MLLVGLFSNQLKSQITLTDSMSNVRVCFTPEVNKLSFNVVTGGTGSYAEVQMPTGFTFEGFVNGSNTNGGTVTYSGLFSGYHRFAISNTTAGATVVVRFKQMARCGAGTTSFTTSNNVRFFNGTSSTNFTSSSFNGSAPSLSITGITNTPSSVTVGTSVTRKFTITNGGFGPTTDFLILDKYTSGQITINTSSFVINPDSAFSYNVPVANITTSGDSIKVTFLKALISDAGIGNDDSIFANTETFDLQYTLVSNTCAVPTLTSQLLASWRCPNNARCDWFVVNTGLSTFGPALPNIIQLSSRQRKFDCFDGTTIWRDTLVLKNNSTGAATNIVMNAGGTRGANFRADLPGAYLDTASFKVRIGKNGIPFKPSYTVISNLTSTYTGCSFTGRPNQIQFTIPYLSGGDTIYIIMGQVQCNYTRPCVINQSHSEINYFNGLGINFTYKNACGNATFDGGWMDAQTYRDHYLDLSNSGPLSIGDGETKDLSLDIGYLSPSSPQYLLFGNRAYREIAITLPNVIQYDSTTSYPVYFDHPTNGTLYPYYRSANGDTFKFRINNNFYYLGTRFHAKVKGVCDGVTCSGILQYKIQFSINPDTTGCSIENTEVCLQYPIAWTSSCISCCPKGMVNLKYSLNRLNIGLADDNDDGIVSGSLNKSLMNLKRAIATDTVEFLHKFYLKTDGTDPSWEYVRSIMQVSNVSHFSVISDSVFVDRLSGSDSTFAMTATNNGSDKFISDISFMPAFQQGDTITVKLKLRIIVNSDANVISFNTPADGAASNSSTFVPGYACGSFIDKLEMFGVDAFGYTSGAYTSNGCQQIGVYNGFYSRIGPGAGTYSNFRFPYEIRRLSYPKVLKTTIPPNWTVDSVELWTWNYPNQAHGSTYPTGLNLPFTVSGDTVTYRVGQLFQPEGGLLQVPDEGHYMYCYMRLSPSCKTTSGAISYNVTQDSFLMYQAPITASDNPIGGSTYQLNYSSFQNFHPNIILSSSTPISTAYTKSVSWPLSINNLTSFAANNNWLYIVKPSGLTLIDSVKEGSTLIVPDANGFYRYGVLSDGGTRNFTVYGKSTACNFDSILVYPGWSCNEVYPLTFSAATCGRPPLPLYVQPQPAAIQTQITALSTTPSDPSNASSADWGTSTVTNCQAFPAELEIQSTQPGTIFNVKELALLPFNAGNSGVDLLMDSVYVEYPIGTTPRKAGFIGRALMNSTVSTGSMELDLQKLDSINFNANKGLPGTGLGTATTRRVIIRWKMKTNCNIISGTQWNARQKANAPCGSVAIGDNTITSGYPVEIAGIVKPYSVTTTLVPKVGGCSSGNCDTTILRIQKIGASVSTNDSVFVKLPATLSLGTIYCLGVNCPGGASGVIPTSSIRSSVLAGEKTYTFEVPSDFDNNNDTLHFKIQAFDPNKASCGTSSTMEAGIKIPVALTCLGSPCPGSNASLGSGSGSFNVNKPVIVFSSYTGQSNPPYTGPTFSYSYTLDVMNSGQIKTNNNMVFKTFFDRNDNGTYEPLLDSLADTYILPTSIDTGATSTINRTFSGSTFPSQYRPMFTIIDTASSNNCMCSPIVQSNMFFGLPIEIVNFNSSPVECSNELKWQATLSNGDVVFNIERSTDGIRWMNVQTIKSKGSNSLQSFVYIDAIPGTKNFYRVKQVSTTGKVNYSEILAVNSPCLSQAGVMSLQPNPIQSGNLFVNILSIENETTEIQILDISGKVVYSQNENLIEGANIIQLPFDSFAAGVYTIQAKVNGVVQSGKVVKVN